MNNKYILCTIYMQESPILMNGPSLSNDAMGNSFAMLGTTLLMRYLKLDTIYYGALFPLILGTYNNFNSDSATNKLVSVITNYYSILLFIVVLIAFFVKKYKYLFRRNLPKNMSHISIIDPDKLAIFKRYITLNSDIFICKEDIKFGDLDVMHMNSIATYNGSSWGRQIASQNHITGRLDTPYTFNDTNFNVIGSIEWKKYVKKMEGKKEENSKSRDLGISEWIYIYPNIIINEKQSKYNFMEYFSKIENYLAEYNKKNICLNYVKVMCNGKSEEKNQHDNHHCVTFYQGPLQSLEHKEKIFIDSFFHVKKDTIWNTLKKIHFEPQFFHSFGQNPRMNILLHGPAGSGKSSFVYRIARCLDRHIVSLDINTITSKKDLYKIIQKPIINGTIYSPKDVIIVLEEFDIAIKKLHKLEQKDAEKTSWRSSIFSDDTSALLNPLSNTTSTTSTTSTTDGVITKPETFSSLFESSKDDKVYLRDLLDILQGTIPIDGSIILATSNKYEEIKDFCPELFRSGRMTPVYFGYLDLDNFKNVCKYYFNILPKESICKQMFGSIAESTIKTSSIIEKALQLKLTFDNNEAAFIHFEKYLEENFI